MSAPKNFMSGKTLPLSVFVIVAFLLTISLVGCSSVAPDVGHQAVLIAKPVFFGKGGVEPKPVMSGRTFIALTTVPIDVDMQPMQAEVKFDDLMSSDGVPLSFDAILRLQVTDSVALIRDFGVDWYAVNIEREFSNLVRQQVRQHGMNETAISTVAIESIDTQVKAGLSNYIKQTHLPLNLIDVTVGKANPPDAIKTQRIETASQQQRIRTEGQIKLAEDARKEAEQSRAEADNAYRNAMSLSPEQFIQLQRINMEKDACLKNHCTFIVGSSSPIVDGRQ